MNGDTRCTPKELKLALEAARQAITAQELRQAQSVILTGLTSITQDEIADLLGLPRDAIQGLRDQFKSGMGKRRRDQPWGGRRRAILPLDAEAQFLAPWLLKDDELNVTEVHSALEALIGRKVSRSTIYRLLSRHGWISSPQSRTP